MKDNINNQKVLQTLKVAQGILDALDGFDISRLLKDLLKNVSLNDKTNLEIVLVNEMVELLQSLPIEFFLKPDDKNNCIKRLYSFMESKLNDNRRVLRKYI